MACQSQAMVNIAWVSDEGVIACMVQCCKLQVASWEVLVGEGKGEHFPLCSFHGQLPFQESQSRLYEACQLFIHCYISARNWANDTA